MLSMNKIIQSAAGYWYYENEFDSIPLPRQIDMDWCIDRLRAAGVDFTVEHANGDIDHYLKVTNANDSNG